MPLALYTFGVFREPAESPKNAGFHARNDAVFASAETSDGFIARSGYPGDPGPQSWGPQVFPRFYVERGDGWTPATLSLWRDIESAMGFAYGGLHREALRQARDWFAAPEWPPYAAWWEPDGVRPSWTDAARRHEALHDRGPTPFAFDFKTPFDAGGRSFAFKRSP